MAKDDTKNPEPASAPTPATQAPEADLSQPPAATTVATPHVASVRPKAKGKLNGNYVVKVPFSAFGYDYEVGKPIGNEATGWPDGVLQRRIDNGFIALAVETETEE